MTHDTIRTRLCADLGIDPEQVIFKRDPVSGAEQVELVLRYEQIEIALEDNGRLIRQAAMELGIDIEVGAEPVATNTPMSLLKELEALSPTELIVQLSIRIYEPPLCTARDRLREIDESLRVAILILDFDTELNMNGMLGFLENSSGLYFPETIEAFDKIGATETVSILRAIERTMERHGMTPARLRADFEGTQAYQITSFRELHGDLGTFPSEVEEDAKRLYLHGETESSEAISSLLADFVEKNRMKFFAEIERVENSNS